MIHELSFKYCCCALLFTSVSVFSRPKKKREKDHTPGINTLASTISLHLPPQSGEDFAAKIIAWHGKISINSTSITSWDATVDGPDARAVESGRAFIAALSSEASSGTVFESRMDVQGSEISYLGNAGDYHNDTGAKSAAKRCQTECAAVC